MAPFKEHRVKCAEDIDVGGLVNYEEAVGTSEVCLDELPEGTDPVRFDYAWFHEDLRNVPPRDQALIRGGVVQPVTRGNHKAIPDFYWKFSKGNAFQKVDAILYFAKKGTMWKHAQAERAGLAEAFRKDMEGGELGDGVEVVPSGRLPKE